MGENNTRRSLTLNEQQNKIIKILKTAAFCLAIVSYFATAYGLSNYVFDGANQWQAYMYSFGIQATLFVLSLGLPNHIKKAKDGVRTWLKWVWFGFIILLDVAFVFVSSFFSWVFICEQVYKATKIDDAQVRLENEFKKVKSEIEAYVEKGTEAAQNEAIEQLTAYGVIDAADGGDGVGGASSSIGSFDFKQGYDDIINELRKIQEPISGEPDDDRDKKELANKAVYDRVFEDDDSFINIFINALENIDFSKQNDLKQLEGLRNTLINILIDAESRNVAAQKIPSSFEHYRNCASYRKAEPNTYNKIIQTIEIYTNDTDSGKLDKAIENLGNSQDASKEIIMLIYSNLGGGSNGTADIESYLRTLNEDFLNSVKSDAPGAIKEKAQISGKLNSSVKDYLRFLEAKEKLKKMDISDIDLPEVDKVDAEDSKEEKQAKEQKNEAAVNDWQTGWKGKIDELIGVVSNLPETVIYSGDEPDNTPVPNKTADFMDRLSDLLRNETNDLNALDSALHLISSKYSALAIIAAIFAFFCDAAAVGVGLLIYALEKKNNTQ
ncbi:MAG: hypothetical protein IKH21_07600 [Clostridia bacterium]|nr:hypothetical protein [Clostridia bacterium]